MREIFKALKGKWNVKRSSRELGIIFGTAAFTEFSSINTLLYREDFYHKSLHSYKEYEYRYRSEKIMKYFRNNQELPQIFYKLKFINDKCAIGSHVCNLDHYTATYQFHSSSNFLLTYRIKGPAKDYLIRTEFSKIFSL